MTFLEVFEINGWNLNITVTDGSRHNEGKVLNYLTAPNVVIWSAVMASCALPFMFEPADLVRKA